MHKATRKTNDLMVNNLAQFVLRQQCTLTTLRTSARESLQMHFKVDFHTFNSLAYVSGDYHGCKMTTAAAS